MKKDRVTDIFDRVAAVYSGCKTYRDTGKSTSTRTTANDQHVPADPEVRFTTAFARPKHFRFECAPTGPAASRCVVWQSGADAHSWWNQAAQQLTFPTRLAALRGAEQLSGGAALFVPRLLARRHSRAELQARFGKTSVRGQSELDGILCHVLEHERPEDTVGGTRRESVWIAATSHLVLQVETESAIHAESLIANIEQHRQNLIARGEYSEDTARALETTLGNLLRCAELSPIETSRTISYYPELDVPLAPESFEFTPAGDD